MSKVKKAKLTIDELERAVEITDKEINDLELVKKLYDLVVNGKQITGSELYHEDYIRELIFHVGVKGKSYKSLAFRLGVSYGTLYEWEKKFPKWKAAKEIAEQGRTGYLEDLLTNLGDGTSKGNAAAAIFYAKNAAPDEFKDKRDIEVSGGVTYIIDTGIPSKEIKEIINEWRPPSLDEPIESEYSEVEDEDEDVL